MVFLSCSLHFVNWGFCLDLQDVIFKGDPSVRRVEELKAFVSKLKAEWEEAKRQASEEELHELTADLCSGA